MDDLVRVIDPPLFHFLNQTIANPVLDIVMPFMTDLNKIWAGRALYVTGWLALFFHGTYYGDPRNKLKGRMLAVLTLFLIVLTDQTSSGFLKNLILRPRPCWNEPGSLIIPGLRLLVECGGGYSFPSSHAANSFGVATFISFYYRRTTPYLFTLASVIAISRVYVGVHYPTDIFCGAILGIMIAGVYIMLWQRVGKRYPRFALPVTLPAS